MHRRALLQQTAVAAVLLAGCRSGPGADTDTDSPDDGTPVRIVDTSFEVEAIESGVQTDAASVTFDAAGPSVSVSGTIWGSDGCKTATLEDASYDTASDELTVAVATTDRPGTEDQACTQAIVEIEYAVVVTLEGGLPETVVVTHDGRTVTSDSRA